MRWCVRVVTDSARGGSERRGAVRGVAGVIEGGGYEGVVARAARADPRRVESEENSSRWAPEQY